MKTVMTQKNCRMLITAAVAALTVGTSAMAGNWAVDERSGVGSCYQDNKRVSNAKYCHNCESATGNNIRWQFTFTCDGRATTSQPIVILACKNAGSEAEQHAALVEKAKAKLPKPTKACPQQTNP